VVGGAAISSAGATTKFVGGGEDATGSAWIAPEAGVAAVVGAGSVPDGTVAASVLVDAEGARAFAQTSAVAGSSPSAAHNGALKTPAVNATAQPSPQAMRIAALIDAPALPMRYNPAFPAELF
jgi:hypothetical protein